MSLIEYIERRYQLDMAFMMDHWQMYVIIIILVILIIAVAVYTTLNDGRR